MNESARSPDGADWTERLGRKVSLRYRLHDDTHPFSEAIGVVMSVTPDRIEIMGKRGEVASIALDDIVASKLFPA